MNAGEVYFCERNDHNYYFFYRTVFFVRFCNHRRPFRQNIYRRFSFSTPNGQETFFSCFLYFWVFKHNTRLDRQTRIKLFMHYYNYIIRTRQKMEVYFCNNTFTFVYRSKVIRVHILLSYLAKNTDFRNDTLLLGENREKFNFVRFFLGVWETACFDIFI